MGHEGLMLRDLVHPALTDPLRNHQNSTFKLIKLSMRKISKNKNVVFTNVIIF